MPDYDLTEDSGVKLTVPGNVIDIEYSVRLIQDASIDLSTAVLLDRVQKHKPLSDTAIKALRKANQSLICLFPNRWRNQQARK